MILKLVTSLESFVIVHACRYYCFSKVLVKKLYADSNKRARKRKWHLQRMEGVKEMDTESMNR